MAHSRCPASYARAHEADPELSILGFEILGGALEKTGGAVGQQEEEVVEDGSDWSRGDVGCKLCLRADPLQAREKEPQETSCCPAWERCTSNTVH